MTHRYSTAFSHMILAGTGITCLMNFNNTCGCTWGWRFACGSYMIIITNSLLGMWRWGNPDFGKKVERPYNILTLIQNLTVLPLIVTQVWLQYQCNAELAYLHTIVTVLPFHLYVANKYSQEIVDIIVAVNCTSLSVLTFVHENYYGIAASISYLINHFVLTDDTLDYDDLPTIDLFNYGLCFFCYFALRTLKL